MKRTLFLLTLTALVAGAAAAQPSIAVTPQAAMNGTNFGLQVDYDGVGGKAYVKDDTPDNENVYRAVFWINLDGLTPNPSSSGIWHKPLRATETTNFKAAIQLLLTQKQNLNRLSGRALTNSGSERFTNRIDLTGPNQVEVVFTSSPTPGVPDGNLVIRVLQGDQAGQCVSTLITHGVGVNNSNLDVDDVLIGAVGSVTTQTGTAYWDEFESFRTLGPGGGNCP